MVFIKFLGLHFNVIEVRKEVNFKLKMCNFRNKLELFSIQRKGPYRD